MNCHSELFYPVILRLQPKDLDPKETTPTIRGEDSSSLRSSE